MNKISLVCLALVVLGLVIGVVHAQQNGTEDNSNGLIVTTQGAVSMLFVIGIGIGSIIGLVIGILIGAGLILFGSIILRILRR